MSSFEAVVSKAASRSVAVFYAVMAFFVGALALILLGISKSAGQMVAAAIFGVGVGGLLVKLARSRWRGTPLATSQGGSVGAALSEAGVAPTGAIPTKVMGSSHSNADGRNRQQVIKEKCRPGVLLELRREPNNPHDASAVAVFCGGEQIGYVGADLAERLAEEMDSGLAEVAAAVIEVTGGTAEKPSVGVNFYVLVKVVNESC